LIGLLDNSSYAATASTTLPRRPGCRLRANASRAELSGNTSTGGRRRSPASTSLASESSWSRFGSTTKYTPPRRLLYHGDESSAGAQHRAEATQPLAADGVEDDIDGFHGLLEAIRCVDRVVRGELENEIQVRR
jgi:hypothetical protein